MGIKIVHTSKADWVLNEIMHIKGLAQASAWDAGNAESIVGDIIIIIIDVMIHHLHLVSLNKIYLE